MRLLITMAIIALHLSLSGAPVSATSFASKCIFALAVASAECGRSAIASIPQQNAHSSSDAISKDFDSVLRRKGPSMTPCMLAFQTRRLRFVAALQDIPLRGHRSVAPLAQSPPPLLFLPPPLLPRKLRAVAFANTWPRRGSCTAAAPPPRPSRQQSRRSRHR